MELTLESQGYLESLYRAYLEDPLSLPEDWRRYFSALTLEDLEDGRRERQAAPSRARPWTWASSSRWRLCARLTGSSGTSRPA